jgi:hypothetical protein
MTTFQPMAHAHPTCASPPQLIPSEHARLGPAPGPVLRAGFETSPAPKRPKGPSAASAVTSSPARTAQHRTDLRTESLDHARHSQTWPFLPSPQRLVPASPSDPLRPPAAAGVGQHASPQGDLPDRRRSQKATGSQQPTTHNSNKMKRQRTSIDFPIGHVAVAAHHGPTLHLDLLTAWRENRMRQRYLKLIIAGPGPGQ